MKHCIFILMIIGLFLGCGGCKDPWEQELEIGASLDISQVQGTVVSKTRKIFLGDMDNTSEMKGEYYYCLGIQTTSPEGVQIVTEYKGVLFEVFSAVDIGTELPAISILTPADLAKMEGEVVEMKSEDFTNGGSFWIAVAKYGEIEIYRIDKKAYYLLVKIGTKLPLVVNDGY